MSSRFLRSYRKVRSSRARLSAFALTPILVAAAVAGSNLAPRVAFAQSQEIIVTAPTGTAFPLVVLTYPATISEAAFQPLKDAYQKSKLGFGCANPLFKCPRQEAAFETSLAKTAYLVQDVYASLQAKLPAGSVVLQPGSIDMSPSGQLVYTIPDPELPAAVRVDFLAYVNPAVSSGDPDHHTTYGRRIAPVFVVAANDMSYLKGTLLAATKGLDGAAELNSQQPSTLIQLFRTVNAKADKRKLGKPQATLKYGAIKTSQAAWDAHVVGNRITSPLASDVFAAVIAPVEQYATDAKLVAAARASSGRYYSLFTNEVAKAPEKAAELLPVFMQAEKQYLAATGVEFVTGLRKGQFGTAMRQRLITEAEHSSSANRTSLLSTLAAGIGGAAMGTSNMASQLLSVVSVHNELNKLSRGYSVPLGDLATSQTTVVMNVGSAERSLKAASIEELRQSFREILDPPPPPPPAKAKKTVKRKKRS